MKRFISALVVLAMILSMVPAVFAESNAEAAAHWEAVTGRGANSRIEADADNPANATFKNYIYAYYTEKIEVVEGTKISYNINYPTIGEGAMHYGFSIIDQPNAFYASGTDAYGLSVEFNAQTAAGATTCVGSIKTPGTADANKRAWKANIASLAARNTATVYAVSFEKIQETDEKGVEYSWLITVNDGSKDYTWKVPVDTYAHERSANGIYLAMGCMTSSSAHHVRITDLTVTQPEPPATEAPTEAPTEPAPTEPVATEPTPTEPTPTEPTPTEPAPTEPEDEEEVRVLHDFEENTFLETNSSIVDTGAQANSFEVGGYKGSTGLKMYNDNDGWLKYAVYSYDHTQLDSTWRDNWQEAEYLQFYVRNEGPGVVNICLSSLKKDSGAMDHWQEYDFTDAAQFMTSTDGVTWTNLDKTLNGNGFYEIQIPAGFEGFVRVAVNKDTLSFPDQGWGLFDGIAGRLQMTFGVKNTTVFVDDIALVGHFSDTVEGYQFSAAEYFGLETEEPEKTTLDLGDNELTLDAGKPEGKTWTHTVAADGSLTFNVTSLMAPNAEGILEEVPAEYIAMVFSRGYTLLVNGTPVYELPYAMNVTAGDVVTVSLSNAMGNEAVIGLNLTAGEAIVDDPADAGTAENPIIIESLPYEGTVEGSHDIYLSYTAAEDCTLLITYTAGNFISVDGWEDGPVENSKLVAVKAGETVIINPWGSNDGFFTIELYVEEEPEGPISGSGSSGDPYVITVPDSYDIAGTGYVYFQYTAVESGKLTITVDCDNWSFLRMSNEVSGVSGTLYKDDGNSIVFELCEGELLSGYIYITSDNGETGGKIGLSFEACEVEKVVKILANNANLPKTIQVAAGSRINCQITFSNSDAKLIIFGYGFYAMIGETRLDPVNGIVELPLELSWDPQTVYLYNDGAEDVECTFCLEFREGTMQNPEVLENVNGEFTATVPDGPYYYTWTAPESGKLTFTMLEDSNWSYMIENVDTGVYYQAPDWMGNGDKTFVLEVNEGDKVILQILHEDYTPGELKFSLSFAAGKIEKFYVLDASAYELPLISEEILAGSAIRYEITSYLNGGLLTITGENFYVVVGGTGAYNEETGLFMPEGGTRYDPDEDGVAYISLPDYETSTVHIVNTGDTAATVEFGCVYPTGTEDNPHEITDGAEVVLDENAGDYYFAYTATGNGYIIVTVNSDNGVFYYVMNPDTYDSSMEIRTDELPHSTYFPVSVGEREEYDFITGEFVMAPYQDVIYIVVNTWDVDDSIPGGEISVTVEFIEATMGEINGEELPATIEIPAAGSALFTVVNFWGGVPAISGENFYVIADGVKLTADENGMIVIPRGAKIVEVVNTSDAINTLAVDTYYPLGTENNPEELVPGQDYVAVPPVDDYGYAERYYYSFTPAENCTVQFTFKNENWNAYFDWMSYTGAEYGTTWKVELLAGETYSFGFVADDWSTTPVAFNFALAIGEDGEDEVIYNQWGMLAEGDNYVEVEEGYEPEFDDDYQWYFAATTSGNLTIAVTELLAYTADIETGEYSWSDLSLSALGNGLRPSSVILTVNGQQILMGEETANLIIEVNPGDVLLVSMISANGTPLRATLNLSFSSNVHDANDGTLILGNNSITLPTGGMDEEYNPLPGEEMTFTFTADEAGNLLIKLMSGSYLGENFMGEEATVTLYPAELLELMSSLVTLTVNGEAYMVDYDSLSEEDPYQSLVNMYVNAGDVVTLVFANNFYYDLDLILKVTVTEGEAGPEIIDELPAELVAEFADADTAYEIGKTWLYTAAMDGTIEFLGLTEGAELWIKLNGEYVDLVEGTLEVKAGDEIEISIYAEDAGVYSCIATYAEEEEPIVYGDVNGDGEIDFMDARAIMQFAVELITADDLNLAAADVTGDGSVDFMDARAIMQFAVGIIESFPVEDTSDET